MIRVLDDQRDPSFRISIVNGCARQLRKCMRCFRGGGVIRRYKLFIKYPQGLRLTFDRIKERLEDSDNSVVSCAVNVICELADKNPKNYLAMAPQFFRLLTTSSNNWMLIKAREI